MEKKETDCGADFEHDRHVFKTDRGKVKACDGVFRSNKDGRSRRKQGS